ncbi:MTH1187 family thiamine-binding protein [Geoglobus acetivorans]
MIVEMSVVPVGAGESVSRYVAEVLKIIRSRNLKYELSSMGTSVELDNYHELGELLQEINDRLVEMGVGRVYMVIKIDSRVKGGSIEQKKESVMDKL